jgi:hypothetical protein
MRQETHELDRANLRPPKLDIFLTYGGDDSEKLLEGGMHEQVSEELRNLVMRG